VTEADNDQYYVVGINEFLMWLCHINPFCCSFRYILLLASELLMHSTDAHWQRTVCVFVLLFSENFPGRLCHLQTSRMNRHGNEAFDMPRRFVFFWFFDFIHVILLCLCVFFC